MQPRISTRPLQSGASRTGNQAVLTGGNAATALARSAASVRGRRGILLPLLATLWWWTQVNHNALAGASMLIIAKLSRSGRGTCTVCPLSCFLSS